MRMSGRSRALTTDVRAAVQIESPMLWLGRSKAMGTSGIAQMLRRRAIETDSTTSTHTNSGTPSRTHGSVPRALKALGDRSGRVRGR
jgi:hypothetical protein